MTEDSGTNGGNSNRTMYLTKVDLDPSRVFGYATMSGKAFVILESGVKTEKEE